MEHNDGKQKLTGALAALAKYKFAVLVAALGAVLMLWPTGVKTAAPMAQTAPVDTGSEPMRLEEEMEEILTKIRGVGRVDVMLTLHSGDELVLASNTALRYSGSTHSPDDYDRTSETVTVSGSGGGEDVVITQQKYPQYRGALVVCEGGGSDAVALQVVHAVSALTGLGSDRIAVVPWAGPTTNMQEAQS